jgi:hypothetical protein
MISHETAMSWWYQARDSEIGLAVPTDNIPYLCQVLYMARQAAQDESLKDLSLVKAKGEVWICKTNYSKSP